MSSGLLCLTCRRYLVSGDPKWDCKCPLPMPSWDAATPATPSSIEAVDFGEGMRERLARAGFLRRPGDG